jgi:predicted transcriptional regulator
MLIALLSTKMLIYARLFENEKPGMHYAFPPPQVRLVHEALASGICRSEDDLLLEAVQVLRERDEAFAGIQEGLADLEAGRTRSLRDVDDTMPASNETIE